MKKIHFFPAWLAAGLLLSASALSANTPAKPTKDPRLLERIDALLGPHVRPVPLPVVLPNPFVVTRSTATFADPARPASASAAADAPATDTAAAGGETLTDAEILARCVAQLRVGGTIQVNGTTQLIINQVPYKEGDPLLVDGKDGMHYLQILRLTPLELTVGLNEAAQIIKLKGPARSRDPEK